jgi:hypothetical protein
MEGREAEMEAARPEVRAEGFGLAWGGELEGINEDNIRLVRA